MISTQKKMLRLEVENGLELHSVSLLEMLTKSTYAGFPYKASTPSPALPDRIPAL
jgi:hypothetical protein